MFGYLVFIAVVSFLAGVVSALKGRLRAVWVSMFFLFVALTGIMALKSAEESNRNDCANQPFESRFC